jgi:phage terminase large subunit
LGRTFYDIAEALKRQNERAYKHEYDGEATGTGANVFENVKAEAGIITDEMINTFDKIYCGLDWGYYPDPAAFLACYYHAGSRKLYFFEELKRYKTGNGELAGELEKWKKTKITADSAEPKSVADFENLGFKIFGARKGPGSIEYGMKWLGSLNEIIIDTKRCPNAAEEFLTYEYERTKDGELISGYPDKDDHFIAAARYALEDLWRGKAFSFE